ncbi:MAG: hypothetical protein R3E32_18715 [Chitinophagales bacterium]
MHIPKTYQEYQDNWQWQQSPLKQLYSSGKNSFVPNLLPEKAVSFSVVDTMAILRSKFGEAIDLALSPQYTDPSFPIADLPEVLKSPVRQQTNGAWLKRSNMVGINVRTVGSFWNVVKYALTLPKFQDSIHLLPIWEPGVVGSLYGMSSWNINREFFSLEWVVAFDHLNTVEKQLRAMVNILHLMGKTVGMDVIPHTDRFSEIVLANPHYFEWVQRNDYQITNHTENLHIAVQERILEFLKIEGTAEDEEMDFPLERGIFFSNAIEEQQRSEILFGKAEDAALRLNRRIALMKHLIAEGYEPLPATMAPPYRGVEVDTNSEIVDEMGIVWRDFKIIEERKQEMSRVFGPLTRYKLYERLDDNRDWAIDFSKPRTEIWEYVGKKYGEMQAAFNFDFMRGDMSHVQMRPEGVLAAIDDYYDLLKYVKQHIQKQDIAYFGYFAETFLAHTDFMGYGDEADHLEASDADSTLGDLQSTVVGTPDFLQRFRQYLDFLDTRSFAPNFTVMTADKDDPRFDKFYVAGNVLRMFVAFFVADMPSYMGLGFETRNTHLGHAEHNEEYSKYFVFQVKDPEKATNGVFEWGKNTMLFHLLTYLRLLAEDILPIIAAQRTQWLIYPDAMTWKKVVVWTQAENPQFVFVANTDLQNRCKRFAIPAIEGVENQSLELVFSTTLDVAETDKNLVFNGKHYTVSYGLEAEECRVYRIG